MRESVDLLFESRDPLIVISTILIQDSCVRWTPTSLSTTIITSITTATKTTSKFLNKLILIQESHCHIITDYYLAEIIAGTDGALIAVADAVCTRQRWWLRREGNMEISSSWPALGLQMMENLGNHPSHCGPCGKTYLAFTCIINKYLGQLAIHFALSKENSIFTFYNWVPCFLDKYIIWASTAAAVSNKLKITSSIIISNIMVSVRISGKAQMG